VTAASFGRTSMRPGRQKGGRRDTGRGARAEPRRADDDAIHLACDGRGRPLSLVITPGQRHDRTQLEPVLDAIRVPRPGGRGRPRKRPDHLIGDTGYSYDRCRRVLCRRGIPHTIPERDDQRARRAMRPGRKPAFSKQVYRRRNVVERCINRLTQWRGLATRFDKRAANYRAMIVVASLMIWLGQ
jgi:transposase